MQRSVIIVVSVFVAIGVAGCGVSPEDSKKLWSSVQSSLGKSAGQGTKQQALSVGLNFDVDCADGGSASLTAELDVSDATSGATNALFGYDVAYDRCKPDENTLDGDLRYAAVLVANQTDTNATLDVETTYKGSVSSSGASNGTCDVDVTGHIAAAAGEGPGDEFASGVSVVYSGTICGHDAHEVLNANASGKIDAAAQP